MRKIIRTRLSILVLSALFLAGCGVTRLWGEDDPVAGDAVRATFKMREQAATLADPVWEIEEKRSFLSQMAGVMVNGARSAGQALDVFDWTGKESPETRQAKRYLQQISEREDFTTFSSAVMSDIRRKSQAATAFGLAGAKALDYYHSRILDIRKEPDGSVRKDRRKRLFKAADEDRRAAIQVSKSLRQQASVFEAVAEILKISDENPDVTPLNSEVGALLLKADELRSLADELKFG